MTNNNNKKLKSKKQKKKKNPKLVYILLFYKRHFIHIYRYMYHRWYDDDVKYYRSECIVHIFILLKVYLHKPKAKKNNNNKKKRKEKADIYYYSLKDIL